jgi:hypothetical protein
VHGLVQSRQQDLSQCHAVDREVSAAGQVRVDREFLGVQQIQPVVERVHARPGVARGGREQRERLRRQHCLERGDAVGVEADAVALVAELRGGVLLVDCHADPRPVEPLREGQAAQPAPGDDDMQIRHSCVPSRR